MIVIKETAEVGEGLEPFLTEVSRQAYLKFGDDALSFMNNSYKRWSILVDDTPVALAGLHKKSLIGRPELWLLILKAFKTPSGIRAVQVAAKLLRQHHPDAYMRVDTRRAVDTRFAEWLGFKTSGSVGDYAIFEDI